MYDFKKLVEANQIIQTTPIKGKEYAEVNQRIKAFRSICPMGAIITEMLSNENGVCVFRATVYDENNNILGTGTAYEKEQSSYINKTSYIENCETSAVGRALGMCGFGIDTSVASADEVQNAIDNQNGTFAQKKMNIPDGNENAKVSTTEEPKPKQQKPKTPRELLIIKLHEKKIDVNAYATEKGLSKDTTDERYNELLKELEN